MKRERGVQNPARDKYEELRHEEANRKRHERERESRQEGSGDDPRRHAAILGTAEGGQPATHGGAVCPRAEAVARAAGGGGADGARDSRRQGARGRGGRSRFRPEGAQAMSLNGTVWAPIGPSPMSESGTQDNGLVTSIAVNPNDSNVIYIGTAQGGVWRSADAGTTWTPLFDQALSLGIGEPGGVAIDPSNTDVIYVGTSGNDGSAEPDTVQQPPTGLYKSTDGGSSWVLLGSGYPAGNTGERDPIRRSEHQCCHRRSGEWRALSRVFERCLYVVRWGLELDPGERDQRGCVVVGISTFRRLPMHEFCMRVWREPGCFFPKTVAAISAKR